MFHSGMKEAQKESVVLETISSPILLAMLEFIYTGDTTITSGNAVPLLIASNQYESPELKLIVEKTIAKNLDVDNVCDLFRYAEFHNASYLCTVCKYYIAMKFNEISILPAWREFGSQQQADVGAIVLFLNSLK